MNKVKLLLLLSLLLLFACSLADVDDESDFAPTYDKLVGCWVSTENVTHEKDGIGLKIKEEPFSSCREICFRKDTTYTIRIKISTTTTTTFRNSDSSNVVVVNDSIVEVYGFFHDSSYVSQWGILYPNSSGGGALIGSKGISFYEKGVFRGIIKNDVYYSGEFNLNHRYFRGAYEKSDFSWGNKLAYHRSLQHDNCGSFGMYIDTTKYTLESLRGK